MQQGEELCRVSYDLTEFVQTAGQVAYPSEFEGRVDLHGGIPLNVGLPDLVLELTDGRRIALDITGVRPDSKTEVYDVRGRISVPGRTSSTVDRR